MQEVGKSLLTADFVDLFKAADNKLFEIELRGHSKKHVQVEIVMMSTERASSCAAVDFVHHCWNIFSSTGHSGCAVNLRVSTSMNPLSSRK